MRFYYENNIDDKGIFSEKDLIKAIYTAWNIEATLYLINKEVKHLTPRNLRESIKVVFSPLEGNEINSDLLKEYGYYMTDGKEYREIRNIKTNKIVRYDWSEVRQLV
jgi:hypothetical protein